MKNQRLLITLAILGILLTIHSSAIAGPNSLMISGEEKGLWLVRNNLAQNNFDVVFRPTGEDWKWIDKGRTGRPSAITAIAGQLHVLLEPAGYLIFDPSSKNKPTPSLTPNAPNWPAGVGALAVCDASGLNGNQNLALLAIAAMEEKVDTDQVRQVKLGVFEYSDAQWQFLTQLDGVTLQADSKIRAATFKGKLYVAISPSEKDKNRLLVWDKEKWLDKDLPAQAATAKVLATMNLNDDLIIALANEISPDKYKFSLAALSDSEKFILKPVFSDDTVPERTFDFPPLAGRLSKRIAFLWQQEEILELASCDLNGQMVIPSEVNIFKKPPLKGGGEKIFEYFMFGLIIAVFVPMFVIRPRRPIKPLTLPETMKPAHLLKRLAAAIIDLIPFLILMSLIFLFSLPPIPEGEFEYLKLFVKLLFTQQAGPASAAYAKIVGMVLYAVYCIITEKLFNATPGKMLLKLRVVADEGNRPHLREILLRNFVKLIELFQITLLPLLAAFVIITRKHQRLGDMVARTVVVEENKTPPKKPQKNDDKANS